MSGLILYGEKFEALKQQADMFVKSGLAPKDVRLPEQAIAIAIKGAEVGFGVMQSFQHIVMIQGKATISAEGMNFLIRKNCPSAVIEILEFSETQSRIFVSRNGQKGGEWTFTMDDAKKAELLANPSWKKYPRNMLFARNISNIARSVFPDCLGGISYTPEELGAVVDADGCVIEVANAK